MIVQTNQPLIRKPQTGNQTLATFTCSTSSIQLINIINSIKTHVLPHVCLISLSYVSKAGGSTLSTRLSKMEVSPKTFGISKSILPIEIPFGSSKTLKHQILYITSPYFLFEITFRPSDSETWGSNSFGSSRSTRPTH